CSTAPAARRNLRAQSRRGPRAHKDSEMRSRPFLPTFSRRNYSGSFNSRAYKEGQILASRDTLLPHNDEARYDAEAYLRGSEPEPVNTACKQRVEKLHNRVQQ